MQLKLIIIILSMLTGCVQRSVIKPQQVEEKLIVIKNDIPVITNLRKEALPTSAPLEQDMRPQQEDKEFSAAQLERAQQLITHLQTKLQRVPLLGEMQKKLQIEFGINSRQARKIINLLGLY